jgi:hypothetical protein
MTLHSLGSFAFFPFILSTFWKIAALSTGVKMPGRDSDQLHSSCEKVKNEQSYSCTASVCVNDVHR